MRRKRFPRLQEDLHRALSYRRCDVLPVVAMVPDGEPFGGTWIISRCSIGTARRGAYEIRSLLSDNDHFPTRRSAMRSAFLRAKRTIDLREIGAVHLPPISECRDEARRAHRFSAPRRSIFVIQSPETRS